MRFRHKVAVMVICIILVASSMAAYAAPRELAGFPEPIDPQMIQDQDTMTWDDYNPIPGVNWADPSLEPERKFKLALIAVDFPDQPFVITQDSDLIGNPQVEPVAREDVPQFYADFYNTPSEINHGQTINGYWMEQSGGKFGISQIDVYGPYMMPHPLWWYGLNEWGQDLATPDGSDANGRLETDCDVLWKADAGLDIAKQYGSPNGAILRIYAGYDETSVWQEFGEMKFNSPEDITPEFGNPNPDLPRWAPTRYVPWTSWWAGSQQWGLSSMRQGESSGTITHELGHKAFSIGDLNNNPYVTPYRRVAVGPWDMMDRGSFNGPEGPHSRWKVPAMAGASMPAPFMLKNRMKLGFVSEPEVLRLNRNGLAESGMAVANVTARSYNPLPDTFAGIRVMLDGEGDLFPYDAPENDPAINPLSPGLNKYNYYTTEVVQRIGYDSYVPDNGVLLALNRNNEGTNGGPNKFNGFIWVIDAHPEDINMVDFVRPNGEEVMRTVADYRQTNDALFHAGLNSGSAYEYVDEYNRLHFYVLDLLKNDDGILSYKLGVRSLDGSGPQQRGVALTAPVLDTPVKQQLKKADENAVKLEFTLENTGEAALTNPLLHEDDYNEYMTSDIYRLSVLVEGKGWEAQLQNALAEVKFGESETVPVYLECAKGAPASAKVTLTATSESDPTKQATVTLKLVPNNED